MAHDPQQVEDEHRVGRRLDAVVLDDEEGAAEGKRDSTGGRRSPRVQMADNRGSHDVRSHSRLQGRERGDGAYRHHSFSTGGFDVRAPRPAAHPAYLSSIDTRRSGSATGECGTQRE